MKKLLLITSVLLLANMPELNAKDTLRSIIRLEVGGAGHLGSINYEFILLERHRLLVSPRIGFTSRQFIDFNGRFNPNFTIPIGVHISNRTRLFGDLGSGLTLSSNVYFINGKTKRVNTTGAYLSIGAGYNFTNRISCRLAYTPLMTSDQRFVHWGGASFAYWF